MKLGPFIFPLIGSLFLLFVVDEDPLFNSRINNGEVTHPEINEASGLAASIKSPGILWKHNDSGDENRIFAISTDGSLKGTFYLSGVSNRDWEDISVGPGPDTGKSYIYLAEIGDNESKFDQKYVYRFEEPSIPSNPAEPVLVQNVTKIAFTYPDSARDAETIMVDPTTKDIYILGKRDTDCRLYRLPFPQSVVENTDCQLAALINFPFDPEDNTPNNFITGGDISLDGSEIIVKSYSNVFYWKREINESIAETMVNTPEMIYYIKEPQGEAICWQNLGNNGYYTLSERLQIGEFTFSTFVYYYPRSITVSVKDAKVHNSFYLEQNYPNPFNAGTIIEYNVPENSSTVKLIIYDNLGRKVKMLVDKSQSIGKYEVKFNPEELESGIYYYKLQIGEKTEVKKLIYLK